MFIFVLYEYIKTVEQGFHTAKQTTTWYHYHSAGKCKDRLGNNLKTPSVPYISGQWYPLVSIINQHSAERTRQHWLRVYYLVPVCVRVLSSSHWTVLSTYPRTPVTPSVVFTLNRYFCLRVVFASNRYFCLLNCIRTPCVRPDSFSQRVYRTYIRRNLNKTPAVRWHGKVSRNWYWYIRILEVYNMCQVSTNINICKLCVLLFKVSTSSARYDTSVRKYKAHYDTHINTQAFLTFPDRVVWSTRGEIQHWQLNCVD